MGWHRRTLPACLPACLQHELMVLAMPCGVVCAGPYFGTKGWCQQWAQNSAKFATMFQPLNSSGENVDGDPVVLMSVPKYARRNDTTQGLPATLQATAPVVQCKPPASTKTGVPSFCVNGGSKVPNRGRAGHGPRYTRHV